MPDAVSFADALRDLGLERVVKEAQGLFLADALGRLDTGRQNAAYPIWGCSVRDRAVADRESRIFDDRALAAHDPWMIFGKEGVAFAVQDSFV